MYRSISEMIQKILKPRQSGEILSADTIKGTASNHALKSSAAKARGLEADSGEPSPSEVLAAFQWLWAYLQMELRNAESARTGIKGPGLIHLEKGQLPGQQSYIFCQALQSKGILICQTSHGWQLFSAHKIIATETFVRSANLLDYCAVEASEAAESYKGLGARKPRISSELFFQGSYAPMELYLHKLSSLLQELH